MDDYATRFSKCRCQLFFKRGILSCNYKQPQIAHFTFALPLERFKANAHSTNMLEKKHSHWGVQIYMYHTALFDPMTAGKHYIYWCFCAIVEATKVGRCLLWKVFFLLGESGNSRDSRYWWYTCKYYLFLCLSLSFPIIPISLAPVCLFPIWG